MLFFRRTGIVNVKMVITEEKILSNLDKVKKMINPNSKKQIIQLEEDAFFKDLIESIKTYLIEYPKKKNFPASVYGASYELVEFATSQFEKNTKQIEELIRKREYNISLSTYLSELLASTQNREKDWKIKVKEASNKFPEDIIETLVLIGKSKDKNDENYASAIKLVKARISNLEANLHIEIDMERIEDRSKALSYIGIEIAEALKGIPAPVEAKVDLMEEVVEETVTSSQDIEYLQETRLEIKPSLWQRIMNSKLVRTIRMISRIKVKLELPALPEGKQNN